MLKQRHQIHHFLLTVNLLHLSKWLQVGVASVFLYFPELYEPDLHLHCRFDAIVPHCEVYRLCLLHQLLQI